MYQGYVFTLHAYAQINLPSWSRKIPPQAARLHLLGMHRSIRIKFDFDPIKRRRGPTNKLLRCFHTTPTQMGPSIAPTTLSCLAPNLTDGYQQVGCLYLLTMILKCGTQRQLRPRYYCCGVFRNNIIAAIALIRNFSYLSATTILLGIRGRLKREKMKLSLESLCENDEMFLLKWWWVITLVYI